MTYPFISICIPTYNRVEGLQKLLDSIHVQTFKNFEILINDNSLNDSVKNLVATYATVLPISYHKNEPAVNAAGNCIKTIRRASAPWIKVMHDDDWFAVDTALQQFVDAAVKSGSNFIFSAFNKVFLQTNKILPEYLSDEHSNMLKESIFFLISRNVIGHPSVVMHKNNASIEYDPQFNWVLDVDFYVRYLAPYGQYHYINETLINIGDHPEQETKKNRKNRFVEIPEYFTLLSKYESTFPLKNRFVFHLVWKMISRYKIKNINQIRELGFNGPIPGGTLQIISSQKYIPHIVLKQPKWSDALMKKYFEKFKILKV